MTIGLENLVDVHQPGSVNGFSQISGVRGALLTITDNHFGTDPAELGGDRVGLGTVAFGPEVAAVPEPGSLAVLGVVSGLALVRRRKN